VQHAAAFSFVSRARQRQLNNSCFRLRDTHAASCHPDMQCNIFALAEAQQLS
jgi:hypothetical protein